MADKKVSELTAMTQPQGEDLLLVIDDPSGTPASRKVTIDNFFGNVKAIARLKANTVVNGTTLSVSANTTFINDSIRITTKKTAPSTNNATTESLSVGTIFFTNTHLYIVTDSTTIKRVALSVF